MTSDDSGRIATPLSSKMKHKILIGDCRQVMKNLPPASVHLIVTSPPYNVGIGYGKWTDDLPIEEYLELTRTWLTEAYRILADGGKLCVNLPADDPNSILFEHFNIMKQLGFRLVCNIAWVKWDWSRAGKFAISKWKLDKFRYHSMNRGLLSAYESVLVMQKNHATLKGRSDLKYEEFRDWKYNVWLISPLKDRAHPAPYPMELPRRLIKLYSLPGQNVLDPFLGSGTTMKACMELGRNSIGIELNPDYVEMLKRQLGYGSLEIENAEQMTSAFRQQQAEFYRHFRIP